MDGNFGVVILFIIRRVNDMTFAKLPARYYIYSLEFYLGYCRILHGKKNYSSNHKVNTSYPFIPLNSLLKDLNG